LSHSPQLGLGRIDKPAPTGSSRMTSAETLEIIDAFDAPTASNGRPALGRSPAPQRNHDLQLLQLCIDWGALAHPSDADSEPDRGIFAAFA